MKGFAVNHIIFFNSHYFDFSRIKYRLTVSKDVKIKLLNNEKFDPFLLIACNLMKTYSYL
jgi:hypothetical protein